MSIDQGPNIPGVDEHPASQPIPSDKEFPYKYTPLGPVSTAYPGPGLPGHKLTVDGAKVRADAAARYAASEAESRAKSDAQFKADTGQSPPLHPTPKAVLKSTPKATPKATARSAGKKGK